MRSSRSASEMAFTFAAPNGVHYKDANVKQIDVNSMDGTFGILPDHVPSLAILKAGVITVYDDKDPAKFFVSSGTVTINEGSRYLFFGGIRGGGAWVFVNLVLHRIYMNVHSQI